MFIFIQNYICCTYSLCIRMTEVIHCEIVEVLLNSENTARHAELPKPAINCLNKII